MTPAQTETPSRPQPETPGAPNGMDIQAGLLAGVAKVDITDYEAGPVNDPLYAKALVLRSRESTLVLVTVDAVAIGEIGPIPNDYMPTVRTRLQEEFGIDPRALLLSASHCHGKARHDVAELTVQAVSAAIGTLEPVMIGAGTGSEQRITVNRRFTLRDGHEGDERQAYSLHPDEEVREAGPVDPQIGILRIDRLDGKTRAVVYNFACHPIQGVPSGSNTADIAGFASRTIEDVVGGNAVAFFIQGCAGDVNPAFYKDVGHPRNAESPGSLLGISVLRALGGIECSKTPPLKVLHDTLALPRANLAGCIAATEQERERLLQSLRGTTLNLKTFLHLTVKYRLSPDYPSYYPHLYQHGRATGQSHLDHLDRTNREAIQQYRNNVLILEQLTRVQANLSLLRMHHRQNLEAQSDSVQVEITALRVGALRLVTFPGELSVQVGLNIKAKSPHKLTFLGTCTNGYIYYAPTAEQLVNRGRAQEDSDCILAPEWQAQYEQAVQRLLESL